MLGHGGVGEPLCHVLQRHQGGGTDVAVSMRDPIKQISVEPWGEAKVLELRREWTVEMHRQRTQTASGCVSGQALTMGEWVNTWPPQSACRVYIL